MTSEFSSPIPAKPGDYLRIRYNDLLYTWTSSDYGLIHGFDITDTGISIWGTPAKVIT